VPENLTLKDWILTIGLKEDPFQDRNAETEPRLNEYFVEPNSFADVLGEATNPKSSVLFAPRGGGKTANRVMVDYWCRKVDRLGARVFVVRFTREGLAEVYKVSRRAEIEGHQLIREILHLSTVDILHYLLSHPELYERIDSSVKQFLRWLAREQDPLILDDAQLSRILLRRGFQGALTVRNLRDGLGRLSYKHLTEILPSDRKHSFQVICDVFAGEALNISLIKRPPSDLMKQFADLVLELEMAATYVLIDGIDEFAPLDKKPELAARFLEPILSDLRLMETRPLAFKFFLPNILEPHILPHIRKDRVDVFSLTWTNKQLMEMLHRRLITFSDGRLASLAAISDPEIRGSVEERVVECSEGLPRNLIRLCAELFRTHVANGNDSHLLCKKDLETACREFEKKKAT